MSSLFETALGLAMTESREFLCKAKPVGSTAPGVCLLHVSPLVEPVRMLLIFSYGKSQFKQVVMRFARTFVTTGFNVFPVQKLQVNHNSHH